MNINSVTSNLEHYFDTHHYYPYVGTWIAHRLVGVNDPTLPEDFGVLIHAGNLEREIDKVLEQVQTME